MKTEINKLKVVFEGRTLEIDIQKELSINENLLNSQLKDSPSSYYILASLRDKYIKQRDALAREKEEAYSAAWVFIKDSNERFNNDYVSHKANINPKYKSICKRYFRVVYLLTSFFCASGHAGQMTGEVPGIMSHNTVRSHRCMTGVFG